LILKLSKHQITLDSEVNEASEYICLALVDSEVEVEASEDVVRVGFAIHGCSSFILTLHYFAKDGSHVRNWDIDTLHVPGASEQGALAGLVIREVGAQHIAILNHGAQVVGAGADAVQTRYHHGEGLQFLQFQIENQIFRQIRSE